MTQSITVAVAWQTHGQQCVGTVVGVLRMPQVPDAWRGLQECPAIAGTAVVLDCAGVDALDSAGVAALVTFVRMQKQQGHAVTLQGLRSTHAEFIKILGGDDLLVCTQPAANGAHADTHGTTSAAGRFCDTVVFVGRTAAGIFDTVRRPTMACVKEVVHYVLDTGPGAVVVVCTVSALIGFVVAFMAAIQLERFGAQIMIAQLVGFALFRELAPVMTSVIMSGRTGSAFAAEIGTMKIGEELDAMEVMRLNPYRYLVAPKILASLITFPCLTVMADLAGLLGGVFVGAVFLHIPAHVFLNQAFESMGVGDLTMGLYKSLIFACLVAGVGCLRGMQVGLGADSVGRAATSAAVSGIFLTIVANSLVTMSGFIL